MSERASDASLSNICRPANTQEKQQHFYGSTWAVKQLRTHNNSRTVDNFLSIVCCMPDHFSNWASLSEPYTDEFAVEFVYIIVYFSYVVP